MIVVYRRIVLPRYHHGPTAFLVTIALVVPATILFARLFASVFEQPFLRASRRQRQVEQVLAPAGLGLQVADVRGGDVHAGPHLLGDRHAT